MGWTIWGSNPGKDEIFCSFPGGLEAQPVSSYAMGTSFFAEVKQPEHGAYHPFPFYH